MFKKIISSLAILIFVTLVGCNEPQVKVENGKLRDGDIIFHTSRSTQSLAIQTVTHSKYSHMGVIFFWDGKPHVYEATKNVRYTPLETWIARGEGSHYVVKRLRNANKVLTPESVEKLRDVASTYVGKPYDLTFEWSDSRIYCSELVWKIYDRALGVRIGKLAKLGDFDLSNPIVKMKLKERYGNSVPLQETVISPGEMFSSKELVTVTEQ